MYANKRTVEKAQGLNAKHRQDARRNRLVHKGMMKSHIQVLPDGKTIQHYVIGSQAAAIKKAIMKQISESDVKDEVTETTETTE